MNLRALLQVGLIVLLEWNVLAAPAKPGLRPMRIHVKDASGNPVAGAEVSTSAVIRGTGARTGVSKDTTNSQGIASIQVPREKTSYLVVFVRAEGYVTAGAHWESRDAEEPVPEAFSFAIERGTILGGIVRDEQGRPIVGAEVTLIGQENIPGGRRFNQAEDKVQTDAKGKWTSRRVPKVLSRYHALLRLRHPDYASPPALDLAMGPLGELRAQKAVMIMRKGIAVEGTVSDPWGRPLAGATVGQFPDPYTGENPRATTDRNGHYRFPPCESGEYTIAAALAGFAPAVRRVKVDGGLGPVDLRLGKGELIRLRFIDREGKAVPEAQVSYILTGGNPALMLLRAPFTADAQGRWSWTWIPNNEIQFIFSKRGYAEVRKAIAPSDREQAITLEKGSTWIMSGCVVSKDSKAPVPRFRVIEGRSYGSGDDDVSWFKTRPMESPDGQYTLQWGTSGDSHRVVRIEADGYLPSENRWVTMNERRVTFNVELSRGDPVAGTVRSPEGKPLADADVVLCTPAQGVYLRNGRQFVHDQCTIARTGADGRFSLPPQRGPFVLFAMHDQGCALAQWSSASPDLTLEPWARVEGTLRIGVRPAAKETITLQFDDLRSRRESEQSPPVRAARRLYFDYRTRTDDQGHFVFDRVRPGRALLSHSIELWSKRGGTTWGITHGAITHLSAGQALTQDLGGTGRPVLGRVALVEKPPPAFDFSGNAIIAERLLRDIPWPDELKQMPESREPFPISEANRRNTWWQRRRDWQNRWLGSEAGKAYHGDRATQFGAKVQKDGSFRLEDLPAGEYRLMAYIAPRESLFSPERSIVGTLSHEFSVPDMPGGRSDRPMDLGTLTLTPPTGH